MTGPTPHHFGGTDEPFEDEYVAATRRRKGDAEHATERRDDDGGQRGQEPAEAAGQSREEAAGGGPQAGEESYQAEEEVGASSTFIPTESQSAAIERVVDWYSRVSGRRRRMMTPSDQVMRLFGYAGTGKTTLVQYIVRELGLADTPETDFDSDPDDPWMPTRNDWVSFGAYTGKAVHVLQRKGIETATTIHRMMYRPADKSRHHLMSLERELDEVRSSPSPDPSRIKQLEAKIDHERKRVRQPSFQFDGQAPVRSASLIVLDEVSMVNERMAMDLLSFGVPILALGDPAQLPPAGGDGWFTDATPDVLLTEIHRSALESPVTRIATAVRESGPSAPSFGISDMDAGSGRAGRLSEDMLHSHDIVLCWRNSVRWNMINAMRSRTGRPSAVPVMGDVIMILANNAELGVFNGQIFTVLAAIPDDSASPYVYELAVEDDMGALRMLDVYACGFSGKSGEDDAKDMVRFGGEIAAATFAQAITVHKSQGSEWSSVLVIDETPSIRGMKMKTSSGDASVAHTEARRWLYTACTRASSQVTIARL